MLKTFLFASPSLGSGLPPFPPSRTRMIAPAPNRFLLLHYFFFAFVAGPKGSLSLKLSDTKVYAPQIRGRLGTTARFCKVVVLETIDTGPRRPLSPEFSHVRLWEGYHESRICSRDTYPESYTTKYTSVRRQTSVCALNTSPPRGGDRYVPLLL